MIPVLLSKEGHIRWYTQEFKSHLQPNPMIIPNCSRCVGVLILWRSKDYSKCRVTGIHIPPYDKGRLLRIVVKAFWYKLNTEMKDFVPYVIWITGGNINTPQNEFYFRSTIRKFVRPFYYRFRTNIQFLTFYPDKQTALSTMFLMPNWEVFIKRRYYATAV